MIKKSVAIALLVIAIILVSISVHEYSSVGEKKISTPNAQSLVSGDGGSGKVGVAILPQTIEDKKNGS